MGSGWVIEKICEEANIMVSETDSGIYAELKPETYANLKLVSEAFECRENVYYKIKQNLCAEGAKYKLIISWYDSDDNELLRYYTSDADEVLSPEGAKKFRMHIIIYTKKSAKVFVGEFSIEFARVYEPKNIKIAAIALGKEKGIEYSNPESTAIFDDVVAEFLKRIDYVAKKEYPDLILLGEHFHNVPVKGTTIVDKAITMDGKVMTLMKNKAKEHGIFLAFSIHRVDEKKNYYATAVLIDRNGEVVGTYDKTHLTVIEYEMGIVPGDEFPVFDTEIGKIGFTICWDMWYPGISQILYRKGIQLLLDPTMGYPEHQISATAYLTETPVVVACTYKEHATSIVSAKGKVLDRATEKGYAVATLDINKPVTSPCLSVSSNSVGKNIYKNEARPDIYFQ